MTTKQYVAFLRGINVGGKMVKMEQLRKAFEALGYKNVRTLLNSGNVVFEASEKERSAIVQEMEEKLEEVFGFHIAIILRAMDEIRSLVDSDPFKNIAITPQTRLYITFLSEKPESSLKIPYVSPEKDFTILRVSDTEVCSVLTISENRKTPDAMNILEKEFGKKVTMRNWNTVMRVIAL